MSISVFDLFKIGIGPSSSHTIGPMRAARQFVVGLEADHRLTDVDTIRAELFGSLGATGKGHNTHKGIILGLIGHKPETIDTSAVEPVIEAVRATAILRLLGSHDVVFREHDHLIFYRRRTLPIHSNGMRFTAYDRNGNEIRTRVYYSVGGGFVVNEEAENSDRIKPDDTVLRYPFSTADELLAYTDKYQRSISTLMMENETAWRSEAEIRTGLLEIWGVMQECVRAGCRNEGILPGGLKVKRRAAALARVLETEDISHNPMGAMDWVNLYALAVNEENAAGGRVVTAPTNGAAGIIPAVLHYYQRFCSGASDDGIVRFLLTAGAIGFLYKENASISGAEVGCQGEVGVSCSMAAGGLAEALNASPAQIENAAEIGMEHNLGLTCDPVGGLVQIPCIERNAIAAVKAINAARMAMRNNGVHYVSLDKVIKTMRDTGADMKDIYKETSRGGLAVNVIEC